MGAQDHVEKALREIHVLMSQCEVYDKENNLVDTLITDKNGEATTKELLQGKYILK